MPITFRIPGLDEVAEISNEADLDIKTKEKLIAGSDKDTATDDVEVEFGGTSPVTFRWNKTTGKFELKDSGGFKDLEINDLIMNGTTLTLDSDGNPTVLDASVADILRISSGAFIIDGDVGLGGGLLLGGNNAGEKLILASNFADLFAGDFANIQISSESILNQIVISNDAVALVRLDYHASVQDSNLYEIKLWDIVAENDLTAFAVVLGRFSFSDGIYKATFLMDGFSSDRTYTLLDKSGIISFVEDLPYVFQFDLNGSITTGTTIDNMRIVPNKMEIVDVKIISRLKGDDGADITVDVNRGGSGSSPITIFTTQANRPKIVDADSDWKIKSSGTPDITALDVGDFLTMDVDSTRVDAEDLSVMIYCREVS